METFYKSTYRPFLFFVLGIIISLLAAMAAQPVFANPATVGLYDLFELQVTNAKSYTNPFDFRVIELQASFTAPSGQQYSYFGFYDGDGNGGLTGNVWKLRFMPNEVGTWRYSYTWTDGTPGGSGSFNVVDTGLPGPLRIASDNSWYFADARANPFHWRGYSLHLYLHWKYGRGIKPAAAWTDLQQAIKTRAADRGYNVVMLEWPVINKSGWPPTGDNNTNHFWQQNGTAIDFSRYYIPRWKNVEQTLQTAAAHRIYVYQFLAMVDQYTDRPNDDQMTAYLRYMAARLGPYWNNFGYSPTWEYHDIWSEDYANSVMTRLRNNLSGLPIPPLLSIHDHSNNQFGGWLDFSMRQLPSRDLFTGNIHGGGQAGGVGTAFLNQPIVGSEDIWEFCANNSPCNGTEVRRAAWGIQLAGVLPVYLEDTGTTGSFNGQGEPEVRRMWDFFYTKTRYRQYQQLNNLVSAANGQVASGMPGVEYLVYDQDGGSIAIDLSGAAGSTSFSVLWFDPKNGAQQAGSSVAGGAVRTLNSPFTGDSVLLLGAPAADTSPPTKPGNLAAAAQSDSQIKLTWTAASDPESGVAHYKIYRSDVVGHIGQTTTTAYLDPGLVGGATYSYQVSAVNGAGLESALSNPAIATTPADATPPVLLFADVSGDNLSLVRLIFSERLDPASAANKSSYKINNGITIQSVTLAADNKMVLLTTSAHTGGATYTVTVNNVKDQASNVITTNSQITYTALYKTFLPAVWRNWSIAGLVMVVLLGSMVWFLWRLRR